VALGRALGLSDAAIDAVADWRASPVLDDRERLVVEFADALTSTPVVVADDVADRLDATFSQRQQVELAHAIAWENCRARFNRAFGIEADGYCRE